MKKRPFSDGMEPVPADEQRSWHRELPVDGEGAATSLLAEQVLRMFFNLPETTFELLDLAEELFVDPRQLLVMLRQLSVLSLIDPAPAGSHRYRLAGNPWNKTLFQLVSRHTQASAILALPQQIKRAA